MTDSAPSTSRMRTNQIPLLTYDSLTIVLEASAVLRTVNFRACAPYRSHKCMQYLGVYHLIKKNWVLLEHQNAYLGRILIGKLCALMPLRRPDHSDTLLCLSFKLKREKSTVICAPAGMMQKWNQGRKHKGMDGAINAVQLVSPVAKIEH